MQLKNNVDLTIKPLYQAFICGLVKFVFSMRNAMSSLDSFLLLELPMTRH